MWLSCIRRSELHSVFLKRIGQQTQGLLFDRAFACVRIGGFVVVGLLVFLRDRRPQEGHHEKKCEEPRAHAAVAINKERCGILQLSWGPAIAGFLAERPRSMRIGRN